MQIGVGLVSENIFNIFLLQRLLQSALLTEVKLSNFVKSWFCRVFLTKMKIRSLRYSPSKCGHDEICYIAINQYKRTRSSKVKNWDQYRYPIINRESFNICLKYLDFKNVVEQDIHGSLRLTLFNSLEHSVYCKNASSREEIKNIVNSELLQR